MTDNGDIDIIGDTDPTPEEIAIIRGHQLADRLTANLKPKGLIVKAKARAQLARWIAGLPIDPDGTEEP